MKRSPKRLVAQIPGAMTGARTVGEYIHKHGPQTFREVRTLLNAKHDEAVESMLQTWIARDWFYIESGQKITLTLRARRYLDGCEPVVYEGEKAASRDYNVFTCKAYVPPKPYRREQPDYAKRPEGFGFKTIGGRDEVAV